LKATGLSISKVKSHHAKHKRPQNTHVSHKKLVLKPHTGGAVAADDDDYVPEQAKHNKQKMKRIDTATKLRERLKLLTEKLGRQQELVQRMKADGTGAATRPNQVISAEPREDGDQKVSGEMPV
jgi:hypothetical protein